MKIRYRNLAKQYNLSAGEVCLMKQSTNTRKR